MNNQFSVKLISITGASGSSSDKEQKVTMQGLKVVKSYVERSEEEIYNGMLSSIFSTYSFWCLPIGVRSTVIVDASTSPSQWSGNLITEPVKRPREYTPCSGPSKLP